MDCRQHSGHPRRALTPSVLPEATRVAREPRLAERTLGSDPNMHDVGPEQCLLDVVVRREIERAQ